jgi:hypothetical protein
MSRLKRSPAAPAVLLMEKHVPVRKDLSQNAGLEKMM